MTVDELPPRAAVVKDACLVVLGVVDATRRGIAHEQGIGDDGDAVVEELHIGRQDFVLHRIEFAGGAARFGGAEVRGRLAEMEIQAVNALRADIPFVERHVLGGGRPVGVEIARPDRARGGGRARRGFRRRSS